MQWGESILVNWFSGVSLLGILWVVQQLWGLRLIPFNVLDALILTGGAIFLSLVIIVFLLYLALRRYVNKHPGMALGLIIGLLATAAYDANADKIEAFLEKSRKQTQTTTSAMNLKAEDTQTPPPTMPHYHRDI